MREERERRQGEGRGEKREGEERGERRQGEERGEDRERERTQRGCNWLTQIQYMQIIVVLYPSTSKQYQLLANQYYCSGVSTDGIGTSGKVRVVQ